MKLLIVAGLLLINSLTSASVVKTVSCFNPNIQDNYYSATFRLAGSELGDSFSVKLRIPSGEFDGNVYDGTCRPGRGIPERPSPYLGCIVMTSSDSGYSVNLWAKRNSIAGSATIQLLQGRGAGAVGRPVFQLPKCVVK